MQLATYVDCIHVRSYNTDCQTILSHGSHSYMYALAIVIMTNYCSALINLLVKQQAELHFWQPL